MVSLYDLTISVVRTHKEAFIVRERLRYGNEYRREIYTGTATVDVIGDGSRRPGRRDHTTPSSVYGTEL